MTNNGIELSLTGTILKYEFLTWNLGILYAHNRNRINYVNTEAPSSFYQIYNSNMFPRAGEDLNSIYAYKWAGLNNKGMPQVYDGDGKAVSTDPDDLLAVHAYGSKVPIHSGSFHTQLTYKNFSLSALFIFELGHKIKNTNVPIIDVAYSSPIDSYISDISAVNKDIVNSWRNPGDEYKTNVPRLTYGYEPDFNINSRYIYYNSSLNIINASNVRLSNLSLAYQMPYSLIKKIKIQDIRFNLNVENVFTAAENSQAKYLLNGFQSPSLVLGVNINL